MLINETWERYKKYLYNNSELGLRLDISHMNFSEDFFHQHKEKMDKVYELMNQLENGAIANPDENRMVGHYWLRKPTLAPNEAIKNEIENSIREIKDFTTKIHNGALKSETNKEFKKLILIGIGGSSLGPRFVSDALGNTQDKMQLYFIDNTDPDGIDRILSNMGYALDETLVIVISKSGGTIETCNGMLEIKNAYSKKGLQFNKHTVCVTQVGSKLDNLAKEEGWVASFPLWDWVGGRTSITSPVGLLPLALQGINIVELLQGAKHCDEYTREKDMLTNPAALLALMWLHKTGGQGGTQMVMLPYKDRLELFSKYLQQLIMESLGKEQDLEGNTVQQGIAVYGNKGSTDQHSYVQQLLDGPDNFFVTFIEVLKDRNSSSCQVEENVSSGDYLTAFLLGTREALTSKGKETMTITIDKISAYSLGLLIALYERAVGFYALLININAYHQPAVEAGKKAARKAIDLQLKILDFLKNNKGEFYSVEAIAANIAAGEEILIFNILEHLSSNIDHKVTKELTDNIFETKYAIEV